MMPNPHSVSAFIWHKNYQLFYVVKKKIIKKILWEGTEVTSYSTKVFHKFHGLRSVHICTVPMAFQTGTQSLPNFLRKIMKIKRIFLPSDLSHPGLQKSRTIEFLRLAPSIFNIITVLFPIKYKMFIFLHTPILNSHTTVEATGHSRIMGPHYVNCFILPLQRMECGLLCYSHEKVVKLWLYLPTELKFQWTSCYKRYFIKI